MLKIYVAICQRKKSFDSDEIWYTTAALKLDDGHVTKYKNF